LAKEKFKEEQAKFIRETKLAAVLNRDAIRVKSNQAKAIDMFKQNVAQTQRTEQNKQPPVDEEKAAEQQAKLTRESKLAAVLNRDAIRVKSNQAKAIDMFKQNVAAEQQAKLTRESKLAAVAKAIDMFKWNVPQKQPSVDEEKRYNYNPSVGYLQGVNNDDTLNMLLDDDTSPLPSNIDNLFDQLVKPNETLSIERQQRKNNYNEDYSGLGDFFERNATMQLNAPKKTEQYNAGVSMKPNPINFDAEKPFIKPDDAGFDNNAKPKTEGRKLLFSPNVPDAIELQTPNVRTFSSTPSTANPQYGDSAQKFLNNKRSTREEMRSFLNSLSDFDNFLTKNPITPIAGKQKKTVTINQDIEMNTYTPAQKTPSNRYIDKIQASNTPGVWLSEADEINKVWDKAEQEEKTFNDATDLYSGVNNLFKQNKPRDEFEQNPTRKAFYNDWYDKNMPGGNAIADTTVSESSTFSYPKTYVGPDLRVNEVEYPQFNNTIPDNFDELPLNIE
jgi:hypothetical protein